MCRIAAYLGPSVPLGTLLDVTPHGLTHQAYAPQEQLSGHVNVDGTGTVWWPSDGPPVRYAVTVPPWADDNLRELAPRLHGRAIVAAVRGATPGMPGGRGAVAPFLVDEVAVAHNGWLGGFHGPVGDRLLAALPPDRLRRLEVLTDSTVLAQHIAARVAVGDPLAAAVTDTIRLASAAVRAHDETATLNLVVSDGAAIVASRASVAGPCNSLYVLASAAAPWPSGTLVASEPLDDQPWRAVPADHVLTVTRHDCRMQPLTPEPIP